MTPLIRLFLLHLAGNAALFALGYYWLGVGESNAANLTLSAALILLILSGAALLHGAAFAYFRNGNQDLLGGILRNPLGRFLPLVVLAAIAITLYFAAEYWNPVTTDRINRTASYLTLNFQTPVRPTTIERIFNAIWWIVEWALIPLLLLPAASGVAAQGWYGFTEFGTRLKNRSQWLMIPALLTVSIWLPFWLMAWKPQMSSFNTELVSLAARFGFAYLLFVTGSLLLAFVASRGKPVVSQASTAVSP